MSRCPAIEVNQSAILIILARGASEKKAVLFGTNLMTAKNRAAILMKPQPLCADQTRGMKAAILNITQGSISKLNNIVRPRGEPSSLLQIMCTLIMILKSDTFKHLMVISFS